MPVTLAFSCEVLHKELWKSVNICKSYSKKISGTFFLDTVYNVAYGREIKYICMSFVGVGVAAGNKYVFLTATRELLAVGKLQYNTDSTVAYSNI